MMSTTMEVSGKESVSSTSMFNDRAELWKYPDARKCIKRQEGREAGN
jgi:hypothetical protein